MDRLIYTALSGASGSMQAQTVVSHNLANVGTHGFRAMQHTLLGSPVAGDGLESRVVVGDQPLSWDDSQGPAVQTGRELDIALDGPGWLAVQAPDGTEAYTRAGSLRLTPEGLLETSGGHLVLGNGGPISLPPYEKLDIAADGTISIVPQGQDATTIAQIDRFKLVNPPRDNLGQVGPSLFATVDGNPAEADPAVRISNGQLEGSNVNAAAALVQMIELSRLYEMQIRTLHTAEENAELAAQLMRIS